MVKIAVEEPFTSVQQALLKKGYRAEMLEDKTESMDYDCVVVRDKEDLTDFHMNVPLVEAKGRTLQDIVDEVEERLVRAGKIEAPKQQNDGGGMSGGAFIKGAATGAVIGAAAGMLFAPKSGKEMQETVKGKISDVKQKSNDSSGGDQGGGAMDQVKEKLDQVKEKAPGVMEKAKAPVDKMKAKGQEMKEQQELKKQGKVVSQEAKEEEKAQKEHEKAEKQVEKEEKKADKEAKKAQGGMQLEELGDASIEQNSTGDVTITPEDKNK